MRPAVSLTPAAPRLETPRLILRGWQENDLSPYARLLADPTAARFITLGGEPRDARQAWVETAFLVGHWHLLGYGMFVVEDRATGSFLGRVGALQPRGWPSFEMAWAITPEARGNGYAAEAAQAATDWAFTQFDLERIVSIIHPLNVQSQRVAEKLGERRSGENFSPLGEPCEIWELSRETWLTHPGGNGRSGQSAASDRGRRHGLDC